MINVDLDWERKSQTVSGRIRASVKERAADSAVHIKMSDVTYQGLAGSCACVCVCNEPDLKATCRDMDVDWWRLCESVPLCRLVYIYYLCVCIWKGKDLKKERLRKMKRESNEALTTPSGWFSTQGGFLYSCSDIAHKQPPWGIKRKDLDS